MTKTAKKSVKPLRSYYYGYGQDDVINAYTPGEWGLGGSSAYSSNNPTHSLRARGLPKPWYAVTDDQARKWFEERPGTVKIARANFPNSRHPFPGEAGQDWPQVRT
jgi:hypothetical protein